MIMTLQSLKVYAMDLNMNPLIYILLFKQLKRLNKLN